MNTVLTSIEAAKLLGCDPATTKKAAAAGRVAGADKPLRPGTINPPWVATEAAWREWNANRKPVGRPKGETTMPKFLDPADYAIHAKLMAMDLDDKVRRKLARMIGRHHYSWDFPEDKVDALHFVQSDCPSGWQAGCLESGEPLPDNALIVGMIQRDGGFYRPLYVRPADPESNE